MPTYLNLCTEFYDIDKPDPPKDAYAFYRSFAQAAKGVIFEPMCGSGRFLLPLMAEGFDVEGSDSSSHMLEACRKKAAEKGLKPKLQLRTLEDLAIEDRYQLAFIPSGSFSLLINLESAKIALKRLYASLKSGGKLVLEAEAYRGNPSGPCPWGGRWVFRPDGAKIVVNWLNQAGPEPKVSSSLLRYDLIKDCKIIDTEVEDFSLRFFEPQELTQLLSEAGFTQIKRWRLFEFKEPGPDDETLLMEAVKP